MNQQIVRQSHPYKQNGRPFTKNMDDANKLQDS